MSREDIDSLEPTYGRKNESTAPPKKKPPPPPPLQKVTCNSPLPKYSSRKKCHKHSSTSGGRNPQRPPPIITTHNNSNIGMYAWASTSSLYWKLLVVLEVVLSLTDVVDDGPLLMYYQRFYLMVMFSTAILVIIAMYIYTIRSKCPNNNTDIEVMGMPPPDPEAGSLRSFQGTLKRAYIKRQALVTTNFHLRLGAVVFGIASLIYYGFEIAVHTTGSHTCVDDIIYALPIILVVLTFLQIHFLFVNSQVLIDTFRGPAQFCFAHLLATNLALWLKTVATQSTTNWVKFINTISLNQSQYTEFGHHYQTSNNYYFGLPGIGFKKEPYNENDYFLDPQLWPEGLFYLLSLALYMSLKDK